jgi:hypothetical protein
MVLVAANFCAFGWELWLGFGGGQLGVSLGQAGQGQEQAGECERASEESGPVFHGELGGVFRLERGRRCSAQLRRVRAQISRA